MNKKIIFWSLLVILSLFILWYLKGGTNTVQGFFVHKIDGIGVCWKNGDICLTDGEWQKGQNICRYHFTLMNKSNKTYKVRIHPLALRNREGFLVKESSGYSYSDRMLDPGRSWNVDGSQDLSVTEENEVAKVGDIKLTLLTGDQIREDAERDNAFWGEVLKTMK